MFTLIKDNVVKIVSTEKEKERLENKGFLCAPLSLTKTETTEKENPNADVVKEETTEKEKATAKPKKEKKKKAEENNEDGKVQSDPSNSGGSAEGSAA